MRFNIENIELMKLGVLGTGKGVGFTHTRIPGKSCVCVKGGLFPEPSCQVP